MAIMLRASVPFHVILLTTSYSIAFSLLLFSCSWQTLSFLFGKTDDQACLPLSTQTPAGLPRTLTLCEWSLFPLLKDDGEGNKNHLSTL